MANYVLKIIRDADKLRSRCDEYDFDANPKGATSIISDLKDTLKANKDLVALAAPQIGVNARIFCIKFSDGEIKSYVNPMITKVQGKAVEIEKDICSDKEYMVARPERILVAYRTGGGKVETDMSLKFPVSALFEQMFDVIDGVLEDRYAVLGFEIDEEYYKAPVEEKDEFHKWFLDEYVPQRLEGWTKYANSDKEYVAVKDAIAFNTSVLEGKTELVPTYNGELKFDESSKKVIEKDEKLQKMYEDAIKKKYGIK